MPNYQATASDSRNSTNVCCEKRSNYETNQANSISQRISEIGSVRSDSGPEIMHFEQRRVVHTDQFIIEIFAEIHFKIEQSFKTAIIITFLRFVS